MDHHSHFNGQNTPAMIECRGVNTDSRNRWKTMGEDERKVAVQEEIRRMHQLPANSSYATHRRRVLDKLLQLMSIQRSASEEEELELLFAGLSI